MGLMFLLQKVPQKWKIQKSSTIGSIEIKRSLNKIEDQNKYNMFKSLPFKSDGNSSKLKSKEQYTTDPTRKMTFIINIS